MRNSTTSRALDSQLEETSDKTEDDENADSTYNEVKDESDYEGRTSITSDPYSEYNEKAPVPLKKMGTMVRKESDLEKITEYRISRQQSTSKLNIE